MRTTVNIDQDVLEAARSLARQEHISIGSAVSRLARRGFQGNDRATRSDGFPGFSVAEDAPAFGTDDVKQALEEE